MGLLDLGVKEWSLIGSGLGLLGSKNQRSFDRWDKGIQSGTQGLLADREEAEKREKFQDALTKFQSGDIQYPEFMNIVGGIPGYEGAALSAMGSIYEKQPVEDSLNGFKSKKELLDVKAKIKNDFDDKNKINNKLRDSFQVATNLVRDRAGFEGLTGADDTLLMKSFANMILPTESVMGDDLEAIQKQSGLPAFAKSLMAKIAGGGTLDSSERAKIYQSMDSIHRSAMERYSINMGQVYPDWKQTGGNLGEIFKDHTVAYDIPKGLLSKGKDIGFANPTSNPKKDPSLAEKLLNKMGIL